jgi:hypothetical protein
MTRNKLIAETFARYFDRCTFCSDRPQFARLWRRSDSLKYRKGGKLVVVSRDALCAGCCQELSRALTDDSDSVTTLRDDWERGRLSLAFSWRAVALALVG